jgi:hypothetical protein
MSNHLALRSRPRRARPRRACPRRPRLVAIGDVHGDFAATQAVLRLAGATDEQDRWIGKDLVVVQTGDQLDRGDGERQILELLERLQTEARAAGGALHVLNGNHELMNSAGDLRYVTAGGFLDFAEVPGVDIADPRVGERAPGDARAPARVRPGRALRAQAGDASGGADRRRLGVRPRRRAAGPRAPRPRRDQHARSRRWLRGEGEISPEHPAGRREPGVDAPLLRGARDPPTAPWPTRRSALGVKRMVLGHTVHTEGIVKNCDGKVWCIDVGMAAYYGGHPEVLEIVGDAVTPLRVRTLR